MPPARKFHIEELSKGKLLLSWLLFLSILVALIVVAGVFAPSRVFEHHCKRWYRGDEDNVDSPVTPMQFLINRDPIEHESPTFTNWNQNFFFTMTVYRRPKFSKDEARIGFEIAPFMLHILDLDNVTELQDVQWDKARVYERHLTCLRADLNSTFCPAPTDGSRCPEDTGYRADAPKCGVCRLTIAHETFIAPDKPLYRLALKVANKGTQKWAGLMDKDIYLIETSYKFPSEAFTLFEVYFRYLLFFLSIVITMLFWVQNRVYREWQYWALEQKWILILLVSVVLLNNPVFFLNIYAGHWIFPFLNVAFTNTFLVVYMLCILLFTDNLLHVHRRLSNWDFYLPKLLLLGALWLVGIVSFGITRAQQSQDIAVNDIDDMRLNGYPALKITVGVLVGIYFVWLLYLILRILGEWSTDTFGHVPRRVKFLWFVAVLMLGAVAAGIFVLVLERDSAMNAVQFFALFALFNLWPYFLSFMYWPVPTVRPAALPRGPPRGGLLNQPHPAVGLPAEEDMDPMFDDEQDI
eukprot:EG_transcript_7824